MTPVFRSALLFVCLLALLHGSMAQTGTIVGTIADAETRTPLIGATVMVGYQKTDNTDLFGQFVFPGIAPGEYELVVSHIGYKTEIINVAVKPRLESRVQVNLRKDNLNLAEVRVNSRRGSALNTLGAVDILLRPVNTAQDMLRIVPGLFIAQHAGGGKAEQIFLRGYDIDHGTDINVSVDGIPVNMVSHAHGQGYADLHFVIPETIEKVSFDKGPYFASKGNLATAAFVEFNTREVLDKNLVKIEGGQYNSWRAMGMFKVFDQQKTASRQQLYLATEYAATDGYFISPQDFHRFNMMAKYNAWLSRQAQLTVIASTFSSRWNASGQVPDRAVKEGLISRFGSIDDAEGGNTARSNLSIAFNKRWKNGWKTTDQVYYTRYHFNLYSDFTFFLDDPVHGDMINQRESRNIYGYTSTAARSWLTGNKRWSTTIGGGFRYDDIRNLELAHVEKRKFLSDVQKGDVHEFNGFAWLSQDLEWNNNWAVTAGLRFDHFQFRYRDLLTANPDWMKQSRSIVSPKLTIQYSFSPKVKLYLNNGIGFHSNDTRVILNHSANQILPAVFGTDLGLILKPVSPLLLKVAIWQLFSKQEFVYVGDEGIVEPGGRTRRTGIDFCGRYQVTKWLFADADLNLTRARAVDAPKGENYVPLAPSLTSIGGITVKGKNGFSGSLRYRLLGDRPANEDYSVKAQGYGIVDALVSYQWKNIECKLSVENIFDARWKEAQFDTESRLQQETAPVSEIHFTPGTPRFLKAGISLRF